MAVLPPEGAELNRYVAEFMVTSHYLCTSQLPGESQLQPPAVRCRIPVGSCTRKL